MLFEYFPPFLSLVLIIITVSRFIFLFIITEILLLLKIMNEFQPENKINKKVNIIKKKIFFIFFFFFIWLHTDSLNYLMVNIISWLVQ
jgi:hypothetical protein